MYKKFLLISAILALSLRIWVFYLSTSDKPNFLYLDSSNLSQHFISVDKSNKKKAFILGSSGVSGSNVPINSTLADNLNTSLPDYQFYNLAKLQGSIADALINLEAGLKLSKPKIVIIGASPSFFSPYPEGKNVLNNLSTLESVLSKETLEYLYKEKLKKFSFSSLFPKVEFPIQENLVLKTKLNQMKVSFLGNTYSKKLYSRGKYGIEYSYDPNNQSYQLLEKINYIAKKENIKTYIYIEPINDIEVSFPRGQYLKFKEHLKLKLRSLDFSVLDYSNLLPNNHDYFVDYIHLTPNGYKELARKIKDDLRGEL